MEISLPVYYSYGETRVKPLFNPYEPDVALDNLKPNEHFTTEDIKKLKFTFLDYSKRKGINFTNVRIDGLKMCRRKTNALGYFKLCSYLCLHRTIPP